MGKKIFEVEISNDGPRGYETATALELPATWSEFQDAMWKARIKDFRHSHNELVNINDPRFPSGLIGCDVDLIELNFLAERLIMLNEEERKGLDILIQVEQARLGCPIPLSHLINLTFNTDICCIAPHVHDAEDLGAFLYEEEMLSDAATALLDEAEVGSEFRQRLLELLGERHLEKSGGVFTRWGYAELGSDFKDIYRKDEMLHFRQPSVPVVLEVRKRDPNDPVHDNDPSAILQLPAQAEALWNAMKSVGAALPEECSFHCVECCIPSLREVIDNSVEDEESIGQANEFAQELVRKERGWYGSDKAMYQALLEASGCGCLSDARELLNEMDEYELLPDAAQPWEYARITLLEKYPDLPTAFFDTRQGHQAGVEMLERDHAVLTDYGVIRRKDGSPLPRFEETKTDPAIEMRL